MSAVVRWVHYGRPAAEALRHAVVAAKGGEPLAPVTVVVPSNHVGVAGRRLLASGVLGPLTPGGAGVAAVTFLTPYRLADVLGTSRLAGAGRRPVSTPLIAAALRTALRRAPGVFAPVAGHPSTESALVAAYRELRDLSTVALERLAARSPRAADVVRLHLAARDALRAGWYDEQELTGAAVEALAESGPPTALGRVVVYLPQRISRHSGQMLSAVADRVPTEVVAATTGVAAADDDVVRSISRLGADGTGTRPAAGPLDQVGPTRTRIVSVSDSEEEVRMAGRAVLDATREGIPLDRIAILHASPRPYARLVHEHLGALGIGVNGASAVPLTARVAGRALLQFFDLPSGGFRRQDVFAWLSGTPLRFRGRPVPVAAWERISREAGVVAGRDQWDRRLAAFAEAEEARAARAEAGADTGEDEAPATPAPGSARHRHMAADAERLRSFVLGVIDGLAEAVSSRQSWTERVDWTLATSRQLLGGEADRRDWPTVERLAGERVEGAVNRLASLDAVEPTVELDVFRRTLELELEADLGRVGRMGDGVLVGPVSLGVGLDLDLVILLGLAEGVFPAPTRDDSLLPDAERETTGGQLPLRAARVDTQHRELLAALGGSNRQLLGVPRGDLRQSSERVPSRWVLQIAEALAGSTISSQELAGRVEPWLTHEASFADGLRRLAVPGDGQEYRLRVLMARPVLDDPVFGAGEVMIRSRQSRSFTRFDGNLSDFTIPSPAVSPTSATRLESWATCPFGYLVRTLLRVEVVEQPEEQLELTPRDRGTLVHEILERFIAHVVNRSGGANRSPGAPWSPADRALLADMGAQVCDEFARRGLTGRPIFWQRDRSAILKDLGRFLSLDDAARAHYRCEPVAAELSFGLPDSELGPVALPLPDGRSVQFRGTADRVDRGPDGSLLVIDYKTGRSDGFAVLRQEEPDAQGQKLQLPVYAQAARALAGCRSADVRAEYWFVSSKGRFKRVGISVDDQVIERVGGTLSHIVQGVEAGLFPNYPRGGATTPRVTCPFCDPDGLGGAELRSRWERKRDDPVLAPFVALVEPEDPAPGAGGSAHA